MSINTNKEWEFIRNEIISSNKGGTIKGRMLFVFQILLSAYSKAGSSKEKQMLISSYQEWKKQYTIL